jgi:hypothetical protein
MMDEIEAVETPTSFWSEVRRRMIIVSTMDAGVRITLAAGSATIVVALFFAAIHRYLGADILTLYGSIPLVALIVLAVGEFIAMTLMFAGTLKLNGVPRYIALSLITALLVLTPVLNDPHLRALGLLIPCALLWILAWIAPHRSWTIKQITQVAALLALLVMAIFTGYVYFDQQEVIYEIMAVQGIVAMVGLMMAATDISEIVTVGAEVVTEKLKGFTRGRLSWLLALLAAAANFAVSLLAISWHEDITAESLRIMFAYGIWVSFFLGLLYWMLVARRKKLGAVTPHIRYRSLLFVIIVFFIALQVAIAIRFLTDPQTYAPKDLFSDPQIASLLIPLSLACLIAYLTIGRRSAGTYKFLGYAVCVGIFWYLYLASHGSSMSFLPISVAALSLFLLGMASLRKSTPALRNNKGVLIAQLNLAMAAYFVLATLFLASKDFWGGKGLFQALLVLAALGWDIMASGEAITNRHSEKFPRFARVSFFMGYTMSVALFVMVSTVGEFVNPVTGAKIETIFESEPLIGGGLILFGAPFLFLIFAIKMRSLLASADRTPPVKTPPPEAAKAS